MARLYVRDSQQKSGTKVNYVGNSLWKKTYLRYLPVDRYERGMDRRKSEEKRGSLQSR